MTEYLSVMGIEKIGDLLEGTGRPPSNDPQIFVGFLSIGFEPTGLKGRARGPRKPSLFTPEHSVSTPRRVLAPPYHRDVKMATVTFGHKTVYFKINGLSLVLKDPENNKRPSETLPPSLYKEYVVFDTTLHHRKAVRARRVLDFCGVLAR